MCWRTRSTLRSQWLSAASCRSCNRTRSAWWAAAVASNFVRASAREASSRSIRARKRAPSVALLDTVLQGLRALIRRRQLLAGERQTVLQRDSPRGRGVLALQQRRAQRLVGAPQSLVPQLLQAVCDTLGQLRKFLARQIAQPGAPAGAGCREDDRRRLHAGWLVSEERKPTRPRFGIAWEIGRRFLRQWTRSVLQLSGAADAACASATTGSHSRTTQRTSNWNALCETTAARALPGAVHTGYLSLCLRQRYPYRCIVGRCVASIDSTCSRVKVCCHPPGWPP